MHMAMDKTQVKVKGAYMRAHGAGMAASMNQAGWMDGYGGRPVACARIYLPRYTCHVHVRVQKKSSDG
jgi:hypothetical protein